MVLNYLALLNGIRERGSDPVTGVVPENLRLHLQNAVDKLEDEGQKQIIQLHYNVQNPMNFEAIAKRLHLSSAIVCRKHNCAVNIIRTKISQIANCAVRGSYHNAIGECIRKKQDIEAAREDIATLKAGIAEILKDDFFAENTPEAIRISYRLEKLLREIPPERKPIEPDHDLWFINDEGIWIYLQLPLDSSSHEIKEALAYYRKKNNLLTNCRDMRGKVRTVQVLNSHYGIFTYGQLLDDFINGRTGVDAAMNGCTIKRSVEEILRGHLGSRNFDLLIEKKWHLPR